MSFSRLKYCLIKTFLLAFGVYLTSISAEVSIDTDTQAIHKIALNQTIFTLCLQRNHFQLQRIECQINRTFILNHNCFVRPIARGAYKVNMTAVFRRDLNDIQVHVSTYFRLDSYQKFPGDVWENLCDYLSGRGNPIFLKIFMPNFVEYMNTNHTCPYRANESFSLAAQKFQIKDFTFAAFVPTGKYRTSMTFAEGTQRNMIITFRLFFSVTKYKGLNWGGFKMFPTLDDNLFWIC